MSNRLHGTQCQQSIVGTVENSGEIDYELGMCIPNLNTSMSEAVNGTIL